MRVRHLFLLSLGILAGIFCEAQNPNPGIEVAKMQWQAKQVVPPSPEAAELGKYGNVPVSLYTGTPSISVPLFELKGASVSLPVTLSYNASGYKPEDAATWVGANWSLNAGGVITRAAMGNPDNDNNYFGVANLLTPPNQLAVVPYCNYMNDIQNGVKETQPDVYYYNFAGHSGKFVLRPDYSVAQKEKDLSIITPCISSSCFTSQFTIKDEQGFTYVFDQAEITTMTPNDVAGQPPMLPYTFVSAWYLHYIYSADGNEMIEFEYHSSTHPQSVYENLLPNKSVSFTYGCKKMGSCDPTIVSEGASSTNFPPFVAIRKKFLKKAMLKRSGTTVAYIDFTSSFDRLDSDGEDRRLNDAKLYSVNGGVNKLVKQYNFTYSYFDAGSGSPSFLYKRLRLDNVQEISTDVNVPSPPAHVFTYNTMDVSKRFTASLDHWGFYNASGNSSLVPNYIFQGAYGSCPYYFDPRSVGEGANREASLIGSSGTMLTKIQYPTGGYSTFEYELNKAKFADGTVHDAGGIRIKQLIDYSFENKKAVVKNYSYTLDDGTTSGKAGAWPVYHTNSSFHHYFTSGPAGECEVQNEFSEYDLYTISVSANSIFGLGSFQGSHVGYTQVTESSVDLTTGQSLGKTVYNYDVGEYFEYEDDIKSGNLTKQRVFRNDDKLLQETFSVYAYTYEYDIMAQVVKGADVQTNKNRYCKIGTHDYYNYGDWQNPSPSCITGPGGESGYYPTKSYLTNYTIIPQTKKLTLQTVTVYDQLSNSYLTTTKSFTYGGTNHYYPTLIEETTTNGEQIKTEIKYVADYPGNGAGSGTFAGNINYMRDKNMMGVPIEKLQYRLEPNSSNKKYISGQLTDYVLGNPSTIYFLEAQPPLSNVTYSYINNNVLYKDNHYRAAASMEYNYMMNLVQQAKTNDVAKTYIWDYNQLYPVAEITGATQNEASYTSFESNGTGGFSFSGTPTGTVGVTGKKYYDVSSNPITGFTNPAKPFILTYWRYNSTSPFSVSNSSSFKQGATKNNWTFFEHTISNNTTTVVISGSGFIDELRLYPAIALMTTQTFEPLVGVTSQCSVNNQILYYEYDGLNRLVNIKDDDGNIVKNFKYNYGLGTAPATSAQTLFYSAPTQASFTRTNCTSGVGTSVIYKVPYGKYVSSISQLDADAKAVADRDNNGPAYANANGQCVFYNTPQSGWFQKQNCLPDKGPGLLTQYTIAANTYSSTISVAAANHLAQAALPTVGQAWMNLNGLCTCEVENTKYLNGVCITGVKKYVGNGTVVQGMYHCPYKYYFAQDGTWSVATYVEIRSTPCPEND